MMHKKFRKDHLGCLAICLGALLASLTLPSRAQSATKHPNIVLILVDDLGYGDVNFDLPLLKVFNNPHVKTPHLARLAKQSLVLTDHYSASPVCSPSRAGILTGRTPSRSNINLYINDQKDNERMFLHGAEFTLAEMLKQVGYQTAIFGKWHLNGADWEDKSAWTGWTGSFPYQQGFEDGFVSKENPHFTRQLKVNSQKHPGDFFNIRGQPMGPIKGYTSDIIAEHACRWIQQAAAQKRPFFAYLPFDAVHIRIAAADQYEALYNTGDARRDAYYANISHLDAAIGHIMGQLDQLEIADDTLVIFSSDNGPDVMREIDFSLFCYGTAHPLRGAKFQLYEGGIRVPGLVRWPGQIKPRISTAPNSTVDLFPTFCELTGQDMPTDRNYDGASLLEHWLDDHPIRRSQPLYWQFEHSSKFAKVVGTGYQSRPQGKANSNSTLKPVAAIREGDYVLIGHSKSKTIAPSSFQLFNLKNDPQQSNDLSTVEPVQLETLKKKLLSIHADVQRERNLTKSAIEAHQTEIAFQ